MKTLAALSLSLALAGCASAGTNYDQAAADAARPGMTKQEVIARLGPPNRTVTGILSGRQVLTWSHAQANGLTGHSQTRAVSFMFGTDGLLIQEVARAQIDGATGP